MAHCRECSETPPITIRINIADRNFVFGRCSACGTNTWREDDKRVSLEAVLEFAREPNWPKPARDERAA